MQLWQILEKKTEKDKLNDDETKDLIDYLETLKEELQKLKVILYAPFGHIIDFDIKLRDDPWYLSEVHVKLLEGEETFLYLDNFLWKIFTNTIEIRPFIKKV
jgi:hypothetical protein